MRKVQWGVLGVARIAATQVIPAMQRGEISEIAGIASRDLAKAQKAAGDLGIPKAYGSYEEMLADPGNRGGLQPACPTTCTCRGPSAPPEAGKHVLCEKPIAMSVAETRELIAARDRTGVTMGEAFMVRTHPQWLRIEELVRAGRIGQLRYAVGSFAYFKLDAANIRNIREYGGGALMDIGCYPVKVSRFVFGEEPVRVAASIDRDPDLGGIDRLTSAILEYPSGPCIFTCTTQAIPNQSMRFFGTKASIEPEVPFNAPKDRPAHIRIDEGAAGVTLEEFPACDQYTIQGDLFSRAIREGDAPPVPLEDALQNMAVIEAIFRAGESGKWEKP